MTRTTNLGTLFLMLGFLFLVGLAALLLMSGAIGGGTVTVARQQQVAAAPSASEVEMTKYHNVDKNEILDLAEKFLDDIAASIVKRSYPEHSRASGIEALLRLVHRDLATVDELLSCYR